MSSDEHFLTVVHYDTCAHDAENSLDELLRAANSRDNRQFAMMQLGSLSRIKTKAELALSALMAGDR